jgi:hypothetical protein
MIPSKGASSENILFHAPSRFPRKLKQTYGNINDIGWKSIAVHFSQSWPSNSDVLLNYIVSMTHKNWFRK